MDLIRVSVETRYASYGAEDAVLIRADLTCSSKLGHVYEKTPDGVGDISRDGRNQADSVCSSAFDSWYVLSALQDTDYY